MFDLNDKNEFNSGTTIFNDGVAGLVKDVTIKIEKRGKDEPESYPVYKLLVEDSAGNNVNEGFYYPSKNDNKTEEQNIAYAKMQVNRVVHIARAVMGSDYEFPKVKTAEEAFDTLFALIRDNAGSKKFNVFVTYGSVGYPNKNGYLKLRYFDFIEPAEMAGATLRLKPNDLMERPQPDSSNTPSADKKSGTGEDESWI